VFISFPLKEKQAMNWLRMRLRLALSALILALIVAVSPTYAAQTTYREPEVQWVHNVKANPDTATLLAKYRCWGGNEGTHLWVSLKQGGGIDDLMGLSQEELGQVEGTSAIAASWYESHPTNVVCNGKWQIQEFTVARVMGIPDYHPDPWEPLTDGPAFLQFCLFDSTNTGDLSHGFAYLYKFVDVKAR
jgi:hypothetical protein